MVVNSCGQVFSVPFSVSLKHWQDSVKMVDSRIIKLDEIFLYTSKECYMTGSHTICTL